MAAESASEVRGPEAMMTVPSAGIDVTSLSITVMFGWLAHALGDEAGKAVAVDGERAARLHARLVRAGEDQRAEAAQLLLEQSHRVLQLVGAQGVRAAQLGKISAGGAPAFIFAGFIS